MQTDEADGGTWEGGWERPETLVAKPLPLQMQVPLPAESPEICAEMQVLELHPRPPE